MCLLLLKEIGQRIPAEAHSSSTFRPSFTQKGEWATGTLLQGHRNMVRRPETRGQLHFCHRSEEHHPMKLLQNYFHRLITKGNKEPLGCKWCILPLQMDRLKKKNVNFKKSCSKPTIGKWADCAEQNSRQSTQGQSSRGKEVLFEGWKKSKMLGL